VHPQFRNKPIEKSLIKGRLFEETGDSRSRSVAVVGMTLVLTSVVERSLVLILV
jgi:hypothetical protein